VLHLSVIRAVLQHPYMHCCDYGTSIFRILAEAHYPSLTQISLALHWNVVLLSTLKSDKGPCAGVQVVDFRQVRSENLAQIDIVLKRCNSSFKILRVS
jgi:hypothetical protein